MSKPALILVPGLLCNEYVWEPQMRELSRMAAITVADHGAMDSIGGMAEAIIERAPPRFAIAGHSMGGRVTMEVVRRARHGTARFRSASVAQRRGGRA
jgi:pimeloyl-ACP methyl ester carboxylesterase